MASQQKVTTQYRQGDVLLIQLAALPIDAKPIASERGRIILAEGEQTGHAHSVTDQVARLFEVSGVQDRFLEVTEETALTHDEHTAITLEPGIYRVRRQREHSWAGEIRRVAD